MSANKNSAVQVQVQYQPDLQRQVLALLRLLGHVDPNQQREHKNSAMPCTVRASLGRSTRP